MKPMFAFTPSAQNSVEILDRQARFPARRIFCVGMNYGKHVREMGGNPDVHPPVFFTKPVDALVSSGATIPYPMATRELHHEIELVIALDKPLRQAGPDEARNAIFGLAAGVDLTRRDLQRQAKNAGGPWDSAKGFDQSAPVGPIKSMTKPFTTITGAITLTVNGEVRQQGQLQQMILPVPELLSQLSKLFVLQPGDLVFTGTPAGVGELQPGDKVVGQIEHVGKVTFSIAA